MKQEDIKVMAEEPLLNESPKSNPMKLRVIKLTILFVVIGMFGYFSYSLAKKGEFTGIGDPAAQFELEDLDGKMTQLADFDGQVVILNYFATWCVPCVDEAPELE